MTKQLVEWLLCLAMLAVLLQGCSKKGEKAAYEEVLSTLSIQKLAAFVGTYPESQYVDLLVNEFLVRCDAEPDSTVCYSMLLEALPSNNSVNEMASRKIDSLK